MYQSIDMLTEAFQQSVNAPINNLLIVTALFALVLSGGVVVMILKFGSFGTRLFSQLSETLRIVSDNIKTLTALEEKSKEQSDLIISGVQENTAAVNLLRNDFRNYQTLSSDTISGQGERIAALEKSIQAGFKELSESIDQLNKRISEQLDKQDCEDIETKLEEVKKIVHDALEEKAKRETQETAVVLLPPPATVTATPIPLGDIEDKAA